MKKRFLNLLFFLKIFQKSFSLFCLLGRKSITYLVLFSYLHSVFLPNLALATNGIREELDLIELDFKGSQTPQRLHVIPRLSPVEDVSHIELDLQLRQAIIHRQENRENKEADLQEVLPRSENVSKATSPVIISKLDIINLPWDLETEMLKAFLLQHTAWLTPLGDDGYKLEFKGSLLGGMKRYQPTGIYNGEPYINIHPDPPKYKGGSGFTGSNSTFHSYSNSSQDKMIKEYNRALEKAREREALSQSFASQVKKNTGDRSGYQKDPQLQQLIEQVIAEKDTEEKNHQQKRYFRLDGGPRFETRQAFEETFIRNQILPIMVPYGYKDYESLFEAPGCYKLKPGMTGKEYLDQIRNGDPGWKAPWPEYRVPDYLKTQSEFDRYFIEKRFLPVFHKHFPPTSYPAYKDYETFTTSPETLYKPGMDLQEYMDTVWEKIYPNAYEEFPKYYWELPEHLKDQRGFYWLKKKQDESLESLERDRQWKEKFQPFNDIWKKVEEQEQERKNRNAEREKLRVKQESEPFEFEWAKEIRLNRENQHKLDQDSQNLWDEDEIRKEMQQRWEEEDRLWEEERKKARLLQNEPLKYPSKHFLGLKENQEEAFNKPLGLENKRGRQWERDQEQIRMTRSLDPGWGMDKVGREIAKDPLKAGKEALETGDMIADVMVPFYEASKGYFAEDYDLSTALMIGGIDLIPGKKIAGAVYKGAEKLGKIVKKINLPGNGNGWIKLKGNQGWKNAEDKTIWKKDMLHKDHWDITNEKGVKIKEVDFNGKELWPNGPKNKNK